jgi:hypothetical protein
MDAAPGGRDDVAMSTHQVALTRITRVIDDEQHSIAAHRVLRDLLVLRTLRAPVPEGARDPEVSVGDICAITGLPYCYVLEILRGGEEAVLDTAMLVLQRDGVDLARYL